MAQHEPWLYILIMYSLYSVDVESTVIELRS